MVYNREDNYKGLFAFGKQTHYLSGLPGRIGAASSNPPFKPHLLCKLDVIACSSPKPAVDKMI